MAEREAPSAVRPRGRSCSTAAVHIRSSPLPSGGKNASAPSQPGLLPGRLRTLVLAVWSAAPAHTLPGVTWLSPPCGAALEPLLSPAEKGSILCQEGRWGTSRPCASEGPLGMRRVPSIPLPLEGSQPLAALCQCPQVQAPPGSPLLWLPSISWLEWWTHFHPRLPGAKQPGVKSL